MAYQQFIVSDTNPNDTHGGGGCICSPEKQRDCKGPYIVAYGNDMESGVSPHVVVGRACAYRMVELLGGEVLSAGERGSVVASAAPEPSTQPESPAFDERELVKPKRAKGAPNI